MTKINDFLSKQLITYLGNKRKLLPLIEQGLNKAKEHIGKKNLSFLDLFSGSGVVSRFAKTKEYINYIHANDMELYSYVINNCYLANECLKEIPIIKDKGDYITQNYAPANDNDIKEGERCFFTNKNARIIDGAIDNIKDFKDNEKPFLLAPLLSEVSIHCNTSGTFKGFYKDNGIGKFGGKDENCLERIKGDIKLELPILYHRDNFDFKVTQKEALECVKDIQSVDIAYLDPPYNQHPYSSNYHLLNTICKLAYCMPIEKNLSKVSGIPTDWNKSKLNKKSEALNHMLEIIKNLNAKVILISYNNEGFISKDEFVNELSKFGKIEMLEQDYNAFRGSRNLNKRELKVSEWLFVMKK